MPEMLTVNGSALRVRTTGDGPDVVMIHGINRSLEDWDEQHDLLSNRYRVTSLDLPGFGESERAGTANTLSAMAAAVAEVLRQKGITKADLVGNSLGGAIAMKVATQSPKLAESLILAASAGFGRSVTPAMRVLAIKPLAPFLLRPNRKAAWAGERGLFVDQSLVTEERVDRRLRLAERPHAQVVLLETAEQLGSLLGVHRGWREELLAELAQTDIPVLVVWGSRDLILPASHAKSVAEVLPNAQLKVFPNVGHLPQIERAKEFSELATRFWTDPQAIIDDERGDESSDAANQTTAARLIAAVRERVQSSSRSK